MTYAVCKGQYCEGRAALRHFEEDARWITAARQVVAAESELRILSIRRLMPKSRRVVVTLSIISWINIFP